jgi:hypothetical protein
LSVELTSEQIEEIEDWLEKADSELVEINIKYKKYNEPIDVSELAWLGLAVSGFCQFSSTAYDAGNANALGVDKSIVSKFLKSRGTVTKTSAQIIFDRIKTTLKSLTPSDADSSPTPGVAKKIEVERQQDQLPFTRSVRAEVWVLVPDTTRVNELLSILAQTIDELIQLIKISNDPATPNVFGDLQKAQLEALLTTCSAVLKQPMIESGLVKKTQEIVSKAAKDAAEKELSKSIQSVLQKVSPMLRQLLKFLESS